ncbi:MAG: hypothetical protein M1820_002289 [Bogoriella megaspora]|nr:MAG: hypothetical protein M1820_002289 [Bogoriella megaspora]
MGYSLWRNLVDQSYFIPKPTLTGDNLPDQKGRVLIVTGGYAGCGRELCKILYQRNGTVYVAGRSPEKARKAIDSIKQEVPKSEGRLEFLKVDFADLSSIKPAVEEFTSKESSLHCLTNNAGVMMPPEGSKTEQGYELQMGTNCLGPYLFTKLLLPTLQRTAANSPTASVRVTWAASFGTEIMSPKPGGVILEEQGAPKILGKRVDYGQTKVGNVFLADQFAKRYGKDGIVSVSWNPGNLRTELQRHEAAWLVRVITALMLHPARFGAYTELFAGWSPEVTPDKNGSYVIPWGRFGVQRPDVQEERDGANSVSDKFWEWCEKETSKWA